MMPLRPVIPVRAVVQEQAAGPFGPMGVGGGTGRGRYRGSRPGGAEPGQAVREPGQLVRATTTQ